MLGVAVVGSAFSSLYGPGLVERLSGPHIPPEALGAVAALVFLPARGVDLNAADREDAGVPA